ncbi:MAG: hypothetical protein GQ580_06735 [Candidatus Thorarchaeota archaeon]|nr:hypothetical protein [Candidatus Thorarchaeota archaeon]
MTPYYTTMNWMELCLYQLDVVSIRGSRRFLGPMEWLRSFLTRPVLGSEKIELLGAQAGLAPNEAREAVGTPVSKGESIVFKLVMGSVLLLILISSIITSPIGAYINQELFNTTYLPGTLYGSISPKDFR